jgi:hypothetical protein
MQQIAAIATPHGAAMRRQAGKQVGSSNAGVAGFNAAG